MLANGDGDDVSIRVPEEKEIAQISMKIGLICSASYQSLDKNEVINTENGEMNVSC